MELNKFFFDLDSTLIHSLYDEPEQEHIFFTVSNDFYTIIHPQAVSTINYVRQLLGKDNVYILTAAIREYADRVNELAGFGFDEDHIFAREDMENNEAYGAYGGKHIISHALANKGNMIVDNLPFHHNLDKIQFMGISRENYLNVPDYFGVNTTDALKFEQRVKDFLK